MKKLKKLVIAIGVILLIGIIIYFFFLASYVDKSRNVRVYDSMPAISEQAKKLHASLFIADMHSDNLLWDRNILDRKNHGHVDIPRLLEGNMALQVFDAVIKTPRGQNYNATDASSDNITLLAMGNRWPIKTWNSLLERAIHQRNLLYEAAETATDKLKIITHREDLEQLVADRKNDIKYVGGLLSIEGMHALEGDLDNIDKLYDLGYRMLGPVHFFDNKIGGSSSGLKKGGLTAFGRKAMKILSEKSMVVDLAHASPQLIRDVVSMEGVAVAISHTGVKGILDSPRNLSDTEIKLIADKGGLIGIGFWPEAIGSGEPADIAKAISYTIDIAGEDHVCLGSDFDGSTTIHFDSAMLAVLTDALIKEGLSETQIRKVMGENQLNFFLENLPSRK